jgi:hypothetical protein
MERVSDGEVESIKPWASTLRKCWQRCRSQGIVVMMIRYRVLRFARLTSTNRGMQFKGGKQQSIDFFGENYQHKRTKPGQIQPPCPICIARSRYRRAPSRPPAKRNKGEAKPASRVRKAGPEIPKMVKYVVVTS